MVVGPNGSGKSNVADAIVWAAGSLTPSEMRAERPDDVLFGGAEGRAGADNCEVELIFDNEDGGFGGARLQRDRDHATPGRWRGPVSRQQGSCSAHRSRRAAGRRRAWWLDALDRVPGQGRCGSRLGAEDRRHLVEEAAGLGEFKRRKHRAEPKLARVGIQVERARDVEAEVRKRLRPLALQATAAERAEKLGVELGWLRARLARLDLAGIAERRVAAEERRQAAGLAGTSTQESLAKVLAEREQAETELSDTSGRREAILGSLYRLRSASERVGLRRESAGGVRLRLAEDLAEAERALSARSDETLRMLEESAGRAAAAAREAASDSGRATARARLAPPGLRRSIATSPEPPRRDSTNCARNVVRSRPASPKPRVVRRVRIGFSSRSGRRGSVSPPGARTRRLVARLAREHEAARKLTARSGPSPRELEQAAREALTHARAAATDRDDVTERARATRERLVALERSLESREGIDPRLERLARPASRSRSRRSRPSRATSARLLPPLHGVPRPSLPRIPGEDSSCSSAPVRRNWARSPSSSTGR